MYCILCNCSGLDSEHASFRYFRKRLLCELYWQTTDEQTSPLVGMRRVQSAHASRLSRGAGSSSSLADTMRVRSAVVQSHDEQRPDSTNQRYAELLFYLSYQFYASYVVDLILTKMSSVFHEINDILRLVSGVATNSGASRHI